MPWFARQAAPLWSTCHSRTTVAYGIHPLAYNTKFEAFLSGNYYARDYGIGSIEFPVQEIFEAMLVAPHREEINPGTRE
jgi:hypothetical protein